MSSLQIGFIAFTFLAPPLLWALSRAVRSPRLARGICYTFIGALVCACIVNLILHARSQHGELVTALPMQLCDWAAVVTVLALARRTERPFELAYCWGLAGTLQALFTPAINVNDDPRVWPFFLVHSIIPASVLWLMFECKLRPQPGAYVRVMAWSQIYLVTALLTNWFTGTNYGFLMERPPNPSLLDWFSDTRWIYVLQIDLTAAVIFAILLLPWTFRRKQSARDDPARRANTSTPSGTSDAKL
jgi:hypothetical integral membrane protein (TIGR02206 family)